MENTPKTIGRYEVLEVIGKGAMGIVYKARDPNIDRFVAIKVIHSSEFENTPEGRETLERFKREVKTAGLLTHTNIVAIYDGGQDGEQHWIAMEYIDGPSLRSLFEKKLVMSMGDILTIMVKICSAVDFAHKHKIIHRDLKPANILMTKDLEPKIADFGIARMASSTMTRTGVILGTPSYMSPEQVTGQHLDQRSDIFSLGIILYELLTGERPFLGDNPTTIMYRIVHARPISPKIINPSVPDGMADIILKALMKQRSDRFQSAGELANAIIKVIKTNPDLSLVTAHGKIESPNREAPQLPTGLDEYQGVEIIEDTEKRKPSFNSSYLVLSLVLITILAVVSTVIYFGYLEMSDNSDTNPGDRVRVSPGGSTTSATRMIEKAITFRVNNVEDAVVYLDGYEAGLADGSQIVIKKPLGTNVSVRIEKDCYQTFFDTVYVDSPDPLPRTYDMTPLKRTVLINSVPEGATLYLDGNEIGTSPAEVEIECAEPNLLTASLTGYQTGSLEIDWESIEADQPVTVTLEEIKYGRIRFQGDYPITVRNQSGRVLGNSINTLTLSPGSHRLNLTSREVLLNATITVRIQEEGNTNFELPALGTVNVYIIPADGTVTIDGFEFGSNELPILKRPVVVGEHSAVFKWASGESTTVDFTVRAGESINVAGRPE